MLNGCNNTPRPTTETVYPVQDGWRYIETPAGIERVPVVKMQKHVMTTPCQYDKSSVDLYCSGCLNAPYLRGHKFPTSI
jgi:hypothetical protein